MLRSTQSQIEIWLYAGNTSEFSSCTCNDAISPTKESFAWKAFLHNHVKDLVALDFFVVPMFSSKVLFVLVILAHERRRIVHGTVTEHPTAGWTAQQVAEAFPWDGAPRYLLRDRDSIYGAYFRQRMRNMGIAEVLIAPRSP